MRIFNELVYNGYVTGTNPVYSDAKYHELLGFPDQLSIGAYTAQVTGASPTLTVQVEQSFDKFRWQTRNATAEIPAKSLSTISETIAHGQDGQVFPNRNPKLAFVRLRITLGSATSAGQVRVWATGRDVSQE
ncbi:MAG TPA: hypothetical protein VHC69_09325 [Polyangiaceae bacterium]|nr:hypothetical protein [Polyangiaceae bacterium]